MTTPTALDERLATVLALSPSPATRRLIEDVRAIQSEYGDLAACAFADTLLLSVRDYADYSERLRPLCLSPAGAVLGERAPPVGGDVGVWWLGVRVGATKLTPVMGYAASGAGVPPEASHWCETGASGWWVIPKQLEAKEAA